MKEYKEKHLDYIQSNIARMNNCSFQMKGWSVAILSALLAIFASSFETIGEARKGNTLFLLIGFVPLIVFWFLDSYYLQQERKFRGVYNDVAELSKIETRNMIKPFEMPLHYYVGGKYCLLRIMFSETIFPLYVIELITLLLTYFIFK